ncbi:MAG: hypothetical protein KDH88_03695 [Chromatiales bacterium]|nr:hypothetical protein [Chromatiales bacterium]
MNDALHVATRPLFSPAPPQEDVARVETIFTMIRDDLGFLPDPIRLYSTSPPLLEALLGYVKYFRGHQRLSQTLTAMIRYLVSERAQCRFCIDLNEGFLVNLGADLDAVRAARVDMDKAPLDERERVLLRIAVTAMDHPELIGEADMQAARAQGWTDRDVFDAVVQAASNRSLNLILRTFKVEVQGSFD